MYCIEQCQTFPASLTSVPGHTIDEELVLTLREALEHVENLRMTDPKDQYVVQLKRTLRDKLREIEDRVQLRRSA